jgi:hypothetical protein
MQVAAEVDHMFQVVQQELVELEEVELVDLQEVKEVLVQPILVVAEVEQEINKLDHPHQHSLKMVALEVLE